MFFSERGPYAAIQNGRIPSNTERTTTLFLVDLFDRHFRKLTLEIDTYARSIERPAKRSSITQPCTTKQGLKLGGSGHDGFGRDGAPTLRESRHILKVNIMKGVVRSKADENKLNV